jgi:hypothetical protein
MNVIKNNFRSSLTAQSLKDLMLISLNGPSVEEFNPSPLVVQHKKYEALAWT